jgi:hypothetical protein
MAEIFIPTDPTAGEVDELERLSRAFAEIAMLGAWEAWLSTQSETVQALAAEWAALRNTRFKFGQTHDRRGRKLYTCSSKYGHHESYQSHEHALFLLVDSHRARIEDKPETHQRILAWAGHADVKQARATARAIAKRIREENPNMPGEQRDALVLAALDRAEGPPIPHEDPFERKP